MKYRDLAKKHILDTLAGNPITPSSGLPLIEKAFPPKKFEKFSEAYNQTIESLKKKWKMD
jgi:hypothetical protein